MKLFSTTTSDKGGREAKKGGDKALQTNIMRGNTLHAKVYTEYNPRTGVTTTVLYTEIFGRQYEKGRVTTFENVTKRDNDTRTAA